MVILFDGVCNLCNGFVQFILARDKSDKFEFASLQSPYGIALQDHFGVYSAEPNTILLFDGRNIYSRSEAVLRIASRLGGFYKLFVVFRIIPRYFLDRLYDIVARNRYSVFGRSETCYLPREDIRYKFLDEHAFLPENKN